MGNVGGSPSMSLR